jgi:hypothetical protein
MESTDTGSESVRTYTKLAKDHIASYDEITQSSTNHPATSLSNIQSNKERASTSVKLRPSGPTNGEKERPLILPCLSMIEVASTSLTSSFDGTKQLKRGVVLGSNP